MHWSSYYDTHHFYFSRTALKRGKDTSKQCKDSQNPTDGVGTWVKTYLVTAHPLDFKSVEQVSWTPDKEDFYKMCGCVV